MPTNTYVALDKVTVGTATTSIVFSSIPATYTDLVIVCSVNYNSTGNNILMGYNGDTGSNYSSTILAGNGSSAVSARFSNSSTGWILDYYSGTANEYFTKVISIMSYSNTTTFKTGICRSSSASKEAVATVGLWRNTAAINQITLSAGGANFNVGSTFSLYGVKAWAAETSPKATGGYVYQDSSYWYHSFPFSGTFTPNQALTADCLVIAGGGGGGYSRGGGGGAGGLLAFTSQSLTATNYSITVGAGGAGGSSNVGSNGNNSQFAALTASVSGGGGASGVAATNAGNGGSGGGGVGYSGDRAGGTGTSGQGFAGGTGKDAGPNYGAGGGGGATAVGGNGTSTVAGNGGAGSSAYSSWATATNTGLSGAYAGGGGGASYQGGTSGTGGTGGGGNGGSTGIGLDATVSTGSGGGGGGHDASPKAGGNGGSGIVIVRYAK